MATADAAATPAEPELIEVWRPGRFEERRPQRPRPQPKPGARAATTLRLPQHPPMAQRPRPPLKVRPRRVRSIAGRIARPGATTSARRVRPRHDRVT